VRQFAHKGFRIEQLSVEAKMLYSAFLLFSLLAMVVSVLYYGALTGNRAYEGAREYYAGEHAAESAPASEASAEGEAAEASGPEFDLPEEMMAEEAVPSGPLIVSMSYRKLLEVTHFHLFTIPVFLLIIAHIFILCPMRPSRKFGTVASGILSSAIHMAAPWIIYAGGGSWAWLMPVTGAWMTISILALTLWPTWAMWRPAKPAAASA
jgi:hypothetical protein